MNELKAKKLDTNLTRSFSALSEDGASALRKLTFFEIFSELHSMPEDMDSIRLLYGDEGKIEDRRRIREYFKQAMSNMEMNKAYLR